MSAPPVSLVGLFTEQGGDPSAYIAELAKRPNKAHWQGTLITPVEGQADQFELLHPRRQLFAFTDPEVWESFRLAAMRAGIMITGTPKELISADSRECIGDLDRWAWTLFELGWRNLDSVPFRAGKWVIGEDGGVYQLELARTVGLYRRWYYSEIGDAARASIEIIDVLREWERGAILKPAPAGLSLDSSESGSEGTAASDPSARLKRARASVVRTPATRKGRYPQMVTYSVAKLRELTGLENTALNRYAKLAKVRTPGRGKRNHRYSTRDVRRILKAIIELSTETATRSKCQTALRNLRKITS